MKFSDFYKIDQEVFILSYDKKYENGKRIVNEKIITRKISKIGKKYIYIDNNIRFKFYNFIEKEPILISDYNGFRINNSSYLFLNIEQYEKWKELNELWHWFINLNNNYSYSNITYSLEQLREVKKILEE